MQSDWYLLESPTPVQVERVARIPGVQFVFKAGNVASVRLHRSQWAAAHGAPFPPDAADMRLPPTPGLLTFARERYLRGYQQDDLPFLITRRSSLLGYEMRLGKTATACAAHDRGAGPLLVVGPLIARDVWSHWIERVHGFRPVCLESRDDTPLPGFPAYFCHFDILDAHSGFLQTIKPATFIIDEIHMLQARRSLRMSTCSLIAPTASRIIGLSGTPMWSNPRSMWPILNLLAPSAWGTEFEFCQRYMNAKQGAYGWKYDGTRNESEFTSRLSEVVKRRTWHDVAPQLPPTVNVVEPVVVDNKTRHALELEAERSRLATGNAASYQNVAAATATLRKRYGMLKVKRAVELAETAMRDGHKVVLWTWHTDVADHLRNEMTVFHGYKMTAEQSQDQRAALISSFQNTNAPMFMVVPLAVGGVAIDLSSADVNIFVEVDWIPATNYQASMRVFKPERPHSNIWLFLDVPVERRLLEVLGANEACQTAMSLGYAEIANRVLGEVNLG